MAMQSSAFNSLSDSHSSPPSKNTGKDLHFQFSIRFSQLSLCEGSLVRHYLSILYQILTDSSLPGLLVAYGDFQFSIRFSQRFIKYNKALYLILSILYQILTEFWCLIPLPSVYSLLSILYQILTPGYMSGLATSFFYSFNSLSDSHKGKRSPIPNPSHQLSILYQILTRQQAVPHIQGRQAFQFSIRFSLLI